MSMKFLKFPHSKLSEINSDILTCTDAETIETLPFGDNVFNQFNNNRVLDPTTTLIVSSKTFHDILFYSKVR